MRSRIPAESGPQPGATAAARSASRDGCLCSGPIDRLGSRIRPNRSATLWRGTGVTVEAGGSKVSEPARAGLGRRVVRSIFPESPVPRSDRDRARVTRFTFLLHLRPVLVPARTVRWAHTCGLGGSSLVLVAILALTGTLMMLVYQPAPGAAYDSVVTMETGVAFGSAIFIHIIYARPSISSRSVNGYAIRFGAYSFIAVLINQA